MTLPNDNIPEQIVPMILFTLKESLENKLIEGVPDGDPTKAVLVKVGRFQDNPTKKNVSVAVSGGDYEDPKYLDGRADHSDMKEFGIRNLPIGEIGGGMYWWRRGTVNYHVYFVRGGQRYEEERAMQYAYDFHGRLIKTVESTRLNLTDSYGEKAMGTPYVEGASFFESGGGSKFIWRGKLLWRVLTWRP